MLINTLLSIKLLAFQKIFKSWKKKKHCALFFKFQQFMIEKKTRGAQECASKVQIIQETGLESAPIKDFIYT